MLKKAFVPYKGYYSTPFSRWQGSMANENSIVLAGNTSKRWLAEKGWDAGMFDYLILGITIGQHHQFYSSPWVAALMGAGGIPAVALSQACTTSTTCIYNAAMGVETGLYKNCYALMTDRCSNGPHTVWPNPTGPGGEVISENWLMDNFRGDPNVGLQMIETAENVAKEGNITKEQCDELTLRRYEQYLDALAEDRAFQKRYMFPAEVKISRKKTKLVEEDEGVTPCTEEGLARLRPVIPGGVLSFGAQTFPADGNCALIVTTEEKARELSADPSVPIQIISYGFSRTKPGYMAAAPVPATKMALENAGLKIGDMKIIKTHNPFIVNDLYFAQQMGIKAEGTEELGFNNFGCSLIYGHPQGPTAGRIIIEGLEEIAMKGGGYFLWTGCAAGDTGGAIIFKVG
ncbi:MAG: thiolase family protein [Deltaproteobacteria bacterium]|nr:thiolase family protein [Deltaproteobacteria bacterium]MBW2047515.1 thiolase family protein [Deltaproteobacteria bacterium]MBW2111741.1 thiolase family protein [Deltaproteobacteria bacterium]MBW2352106.1 thiolase family protein [Deltaproteobacteria bacterium]